MFHLKNDSKIFFFFFSDISFHLSMPHGFAHRILFSGRSCQEVALAKTEKAETKDLADKVSSSALRAVTYLVSWRGTKIVGAGRATPGIFPWNPPWSRAECDSMAPRRAELYLSQDELKEEWLGSKFSAFRLHLHCWQAGHFLQGRISYPNIPMVTAVCCMLMWRGSSNIVRNIVPEAGMIP
jgi:hypothetical protein